MPRTTLRKRFAKIDERSSNQYQTLQLNQSEKQEANSKRSKIEEKTIGSNKYFTTADDKEISMNDTYLPNVDQESENCQHMF